MIPEDDPSRCPTCHGIHVGFACPVESLQKRRAEFEAAQKEYREEPKVKRFHKARAALAGASRKKKP